MSDQTRSLQTSTRFLVAMLWVAMALALCKGEMARAQTVASVFWCCVAQGRLSAEHPGGQALPPGCGGAAVSHPWRYGLVADCAADARGRREISARPAVRGFNTILVNLLEHRFSSDPPANAYRRHPFLIAR